MVKPPVQIEPRARQAILDFVDSIVPDGGDSVWLTGSRVRGNHRPDSDWDVVAFTSDAQPGADKLFKFNQMSPGRIDGGPVQLVIAHPSHWDDPRPYMAELRQLGIRLR
jgi:Nucleotidyltransferase domain